MLSIQSSTRFNKMHKRACRRWKGNYRFSIYVVINSILTVCGCKYTVGRATNKRIPILQHSGEIQLFCSFLKFHEFFWHISLFFYTYDCLYRDRRWYSRHLLVKTFLALKKKAKVPNNRDNTVLSVYTDNFVGSKEDTLWFTVWIIKKNFFFHSKLKWRIVLLM